MIHRKYILVAAYTADVGCHAIGLSPCHQRLPQAACSQERGSFHLGPQTPHIRLPRGLTLSQCPSGYAKMGLVSCCNSASIPAENETVNSPCCTSNLRTCFFWNTYHPSLCMREEATPSPFLPSKEKGKSNAGSPQSCNFYRFQASASTG